MIEPWQQLSASPYDCLYYRSAAAVKLVERFLQPAAIFNPSHTAGRIHAAVEAKSAPGKKSQCRKKLKKARKLDLKTQLPKVKAETKKKNKVENAGNSPSSAESRPKCLSRPLRPVSQPALAEDQDQSMQEHFLSSLSLHSHWLTRPAS